MTGPSPYNGRFVVASGPPLFSMTKLIALSQLAGNYGVVQAGQEFETDDDTARELLARGYVKHACDPEVVYETQAITPTEAPRVTPRKPFRHGIMRHPQPSPVDPENARIVPPPDVSGS